MIRLLHSLSADAHLDNATLIQLSVRILGQLRFAYALPMIKYSPITRLNEACSVALLAKLHEVLPPQ